MKKFKVVMFEHVTYTVEVTARTFDAARRKAERQLLGKDGLRCPAGVHCEVDARDWEGEEIANG